MTEVTGRADAGADGADDEVVVRIDDLIKSYPGSSRRDDRVLAVKGVSFAITQGEFFTLLGPSGCGKTTTLRCVAGLETPDAGEIVVGGRTLYSSERRVDVPVNDRRIGMVFQSYAIWPHMTVFENVAFPLRVRSRKERPNRAELAEKVERAIATVELNGLGDRQATDLSGGQQQRLALARALVAESPLMLLDEPLSNLDAKLRDSMRLELKSLQRSLRFTAMYVTHDQVEALALSTRIAVMNHGEVQQIGRPRDIYENPANQFVADFIGRSNFVDGTIVGVPRDGWFEVDTPLGRLRANGAGGQSVGSTAVVAIRPEHVEIREVADGGAAPGAVVGEVEARQFLGEYVDHMVRVGDIRIEARMNPSVTLAPGTKVEVHMPEDYVRVLRG